MCNINYKFIYYANQPFSYFSQLTVIIIFDNSVTGYTTLLCITITWIYSSFIFACWLRLNLMWVWRDSWLMYDLYDVSIITLVIVYVYPAWVDQILWFCLTFLHHLTLLILRRPCLKAEILRHLYRFICTFLTKAACCRNIEIVLHPMTLSYI